MRLPDHVDGKLREITLFEQWMGMTPEECDAIGAPDDELDQGPLPPLHEQ